jgi:cyclic di-GMP phosphodiesterase
MSQAEPSVLIVDDERVNIDILVDLLKPQYRTLVATSGEQALKRAAGQRAPDILLLDVMMPGMDGYEVCRRLKADPATRDIPVIFVTAMSEVGDEAKGFALGAVDYITKPVVPVLVEARVKAHLENKHARDFIEDRNRVLQGMVLERTRELVATQDATILSMATLAETRDPETGHHLQRTQGYVRSLAACLGAQSRFREELNERVVDLLFKSAPLHDIGKVGVPDEILHKPGKLDEREWEIMRQHPVIGERILRAIPGFGAIARMVRHEHERWDGGGYPDGLAGTAIPVGSRIILACDAYHAMTSDRPYRKAMPHSDAMSELTANAGSQFDPDVVQALVGYLFGRRQAGLAAV